MTEDERAMLEKAMAEIMYQATEAQRIMEDAGQSAVSPKAYAALRTMARRAGDIKRLAIHSLDDI